MGDQPNHRNAKASRDLSGHLAPYSNVGVFMSIRIIEENGVKYHFQFGEEGLHCISHPEDVPIPAMQKALREWMEYEPICKACDGSGLARWGDSKCPVC